jgi:formate dehydrogenase maturation protein FdhE
MADFEVRGEVDATFVFCDNCDHVLYAFTEQEWEKDNLKQITCANCHTVFKVRYLGEGATMVKKLYQLPYGCQCK